MSPIIFSRDIGIVCVDLLDPRYAPLGKKSWWAFYKSEKIPGNTTNVFSGQSKQPI